MSKLSTLAKVHTYKAEFPENNIEAFKLGFEEGFEAAIKTLKEDVLLKMAKLEQYPMMTERIFALKAYLKTIEEMFEEMKSNG